MADNNREQVVCVCDGSIDGIFCAIYRAWHIGTSRTRIAVEYGNMELFVSYEDVITDYDISEKVADTIIRKISREAYEYICRAAMSTDVNRGEAIYRFMILGMKVGGKVVEYLGESYVSLVMKLQKQVWYEFHRYLGFLRFDEKKGVLVALFEPKSNCLELAAEHFSDRLKVEDWVIIDAKRMRGAFHKANVGFVLSDVTKEQIESLRIKEDKYREMWQVFFDTIAIKERENTKLQRNNMPLRYRKYM